MKRLILILLAALLLFAAGTAVAEEQVVDSAGVQTEKLAEESEQDPDSEAAPAADACLHMHTKTEYYFDAPVYRPVDGESHAVDGRAVMTVICEDCGAVLSSETENSAEEISPHVFRDSRCALCGWEAPAAAAAETAAPAVREAVVSLPAIDGAGQYACTLTGRDLEEADTLVLLPDGRDTALVVETEKFLDEIVRSGGTLTAEIVKPGGQNVSASIRVYGADGTEVVPAGPGVSLRIYAENRDTPYTVSFTGPSGSAVEEARWVNSSGGGYWTVTWRGNGMYEYQ